MANSKDNSNNFELGVIKVYLNAGKFDIAKKSIEKLLEKDNYNCQLYWYTMMINNGMKNEDMLIESGKDITQDENYLLAIGFAELTGNNELKNHYENIANKTLKKVSVSQQKVVNYTYVEEGEECGEEPAVSAVQEYISTTTTSTTTTKRAVAKKSTTNDYTWEELEKISKEIVSGNLTNSEIKRKYNIALGDIKDGKINGKSVKYRIIGFKHDVLSSDHKTKAGITFQTVDCHEVAKMNKNGQNTGGWEKCEVRDHLNNEVLYELDQDLINLIKPVDKYTTDGGSSSYKKIVCTSDKLFLLSAVELLANGKVCNGNYTVDTYAQNGNKEGNQYQYWKEEGTYSTGSYGYPCYANAKKEHGSRSVDWWLRTCVFFNTKNFCNVMTNACPNSSGADATAGLSFAFAI